MKLYQAIPGMTREQLAEYFRDKCYPECNKDCCSCHADMMWSRYSEPDSWKKLEEDIENRTYDRYGDDGFAQDVIRRAKELAGLDKTER